MQVKKLEIKTIQDGSTSDRLDVTYSIHTDQGKFENLHAIYSKNLKYFTSLERPQGARVDKINKELGKAFGKTIEYLFI